MGDMLIGIESYEGDCVLKGPTVSHAQLGRLVRSVCEQHGCERDSFIRAFCEETGYKAVSGEIDDIRLVIDLDVLRVYRPKGKRFK